MKKKLLAVTAAALSAVFAFALAACDDGETTGGSGTHTHTYSEQWSYNDTDHWHACTGADCDEVTDKAAHTWDNGTITAEPTCTAKGEKTYACTVCSATKTEEIATAEHTFSDKWESDETHHWHKCINCDEISGKAEHAYTDGVCVCGHIKPNTDPMPEFDPIDTLDELYNTPKPDEKDFTEEKYGANYELFYQNAVKEYNEAQNKQAKIYKTLNETLLDNMVERAQVANASVEKVKNLAWEINTSIDGKTIEKIIARYFHEDFRDICYVVQWVKTTDILTLEDLYNPDYEKLEDAFTVGNPFNPKASYVKEFGYYCPISHQESQKDLLTAITAKIGTKLDGNVQSFIRVIGGSTDLELGGTANMYTVLNVSENGYEEYGISILDSSNGKTVIENLNNGDYKTYSEKTGTFSGQYLDVNSGKDTIDLPAAELLATPAEYKGYAAN